VRRSSKSKRPPPRRLTNKQIIYFPVGGFYLAPSKRKRACKHAIFPFFGRRLLIVLINAFFGLPPVVVGLVLYLAFSRSGPLGTFALLFTPTAMVIAQTILAIPIIAALVHRASERAWSRYGDELITDVATRLQAVPQILMIIRANLVTAVLAGFGRTVSEVGAVIVQKNKPPSHGAAFEIHSVNHSYPNSVRIHWRAPVLG
jgi:ABC-type sulfate transport system permease subunit